MFTSGFLQNVDLRARRATAAGTADKRADSAERSSADMRTLISLICCGLLAAMLLQPAFAQRGGAGEGGGQRMQGGGINYAPQPAVYSVVSVNSYSRTVRMRAADGRTGDVYVGDGIYDLSKLKSGDRIRVDFVAPDAANDKKLSAASIWPVN